jgi:hypothetical protein
VNVEVHVAEAVLPARVHVVKDPVTPVSDSVKVPVGVVAIEDVSVTVTAQVDGWLMTTGVVQLTVVVVPCGLTTMLVVPLLPAWLVSPG